MVDFRKKHTNIITTHRTRFLSYFGNFEALTPSSVDICPNNPLLYHSWPMIFIKIWIWRYSAVASIQEHALGPMLLGNFCLNRLLKFTYGKQASTRSLVSGLTTHGILAACLPSPVLNSYNCNVRLQTGSSGGISFNSASQHSGCTILVSLEMLGQCWTLSFLECSSQLLWCQLN